MMVTVCVSRWRLITVQSVAFRDLTCHDQDFYLRFHLISVQN